MKNLFGTVLLAFVVIISFVDGSDQRPPRDPRLKKQQARKIGSSQSEVLAKLRPRPLLSRRQINDEIASSSGQGASSSGHGASSSGHGASSSGQEPSSSGHGASTSGQEPSSPRNLQLNVPRPHLPQISLLNFPYADRWIHVSFDVHGIPCRINFSKSNRILSQEDYDTSIITKYLEFVGGIFFVVTMIERDGEKSMARVDNAPGFNQKGFPTTGPEPSETSHILGREISIYRDRRTKQITSMRFTDRNICPTEDECREFQITSKTYPFGSSGRNLRYYRLKNGYFMGVEVV